MKMSLMVAAFAAFVSVPAFAQDAPAADAAVAAPDPVRLAEARKLMDQISPPAKRDAMVEAMIRPMIVNMQRAFEESPQFKKMFAEKPELRAKMLSFMHGELERSITIARESMPAMFDAMATAYARRFSSRQMADIARFFDTPTGRAYTEQAPTLMNDPAVQTAERAMIARSLDGLQDRVKAMAETILSDAKKKG